MISFWCYEWRIKSAMDVHSGTSSGVLSSIDFCRIFYVNIGKPSGFLSLFLCPHCSICLFWPRKLLSLWFRSFLNDLMCIYSARGHTSTRTTCSIVSKRLVSLEIDMRKEMKGSQSSYWETTQCLLEKPDYDLINDILFDEVTISMCNEGMRGFWKDNVDPTLWK